MSSIYEQRKYVIIKQWSKSIGLTQSPFKKGDFFPGKVLLLHLFNKEMNHETQKWHPGTLL